METDREVHDMGQSSATAYKNNVCACNWSNHSRLKYDCVLLAQEIYADALDIARLSKVSGVLQK